MFPSDVKPIPLLGVWQQFFISAWKENYFVKSALETAHKHVWVWGNHEHYCAPLSSPICRTNYRGSMVKDHKVSSIHYFVVAT